MWLVDPRGGAAAVVVGRYAPSPTGALHLGNLRTAVAAWASARSRGGRFLLRIEDLDRDRCQAGFEARQLADLRLLGIDWDDEPLRQSERDAIYAETLDRLVHQRLVYPCFCSRRDIREATSAPHGPAGAAYPGTCRSLPWHESQARIAAGERHSWRLRVEAAPRLFFDGFMGEVPIDLCQDTGDFVVRRADGYYSYQLACAVDDALSGVTEVVRGDDLLASGLRQAWLLDCLGMAVPRYLHVPLLHGAGGRRLAKRHNSEDLTGVMDRGHDVTAVVSYLAWSLGQVPRGERVTMAELAGRWNWANVHREVGTFEEKDLEAFLPG